MRYGWMIFADPETYRKWLIILSSIFIAVLVVTIVIGIIANIKRKRINREMKERADYIRQVVEKKRSGKYVQGTSALMGYVQIISEEEAKEILRLSNEKAKDIIQESARECQENPDHDKIIVDSIIDRGDENV